MRFDVVIIGAGPAGSTLATLLAQRGVSTALIEKDSFPRDKVCGEFLSYDALPVLDLIGASRFLDELGSPRISRGRIVAGAARLDFELPAAARGVSRVALDVDLFERARRAGATVMDRTAVDEFSRSGQLNTIRAVRDGEQLEIEATVVVGAWGRWGRLDLKLGRPFARRTKRAFGFKRHYLTAKSTPDTIELYSYADGYLGVSCIEGGLTNICGLVGADRIRGLRGGWDAFIETLRRESKELDQLYDSAVPVDAHVLSSDPVILTAKSASESELFMIGDCAGIVDPLTGNGMAMAVQSALLAAPFILTAISGDGAAARLDYAVEHDNFFKSRLRWSRLIARLLTRPTLMRSGARAPGASRIAQSLTAATRASDRAIDRAISRWRTTASVC